MSTRCADAAPARAVRARVGGTLRPVRKLAVVRGSSRRAPATRAASVAACSAAATASWPFFYVFAPCRRWLAAGAAKARRGLCWVDGRGAQAAGVTMGAAGAGLGDQPGGASTRACTAAAPSSLCFSPAAAAQGRFFTEQLRRCTPAPTRAGCRQTRRHRWPAGTAAAMRHGRPWTRGTSTAASRRLAAG